MKIEGSDEERTTNIKTTSITYKLVENNNYRSAE
jgi:hypothetical protein